MVHHGSTPYYITAIPDPPDDWFLGTVGRKKREVQTREERLEEWRRMKEEEHEIERQAEILLQANSEYTLLIQYGWFNIVSQDEKVALASIHPVNLQRST